MSILSFFRRKRVLPAADPPEALCMILTRREEPPDDATLRNALPATFRIEASSDRGSTRVWTLKIPFVQRAAVAFIRQPVPNGEAEAAAETPLWSDGPEEAKHRSHVAVACQAAEGDAIDSALLLTAIVREMLAPFDATAVYWRAGAVTVPRQRFEFVAPFATRDQLPLELWCRFHLFRVDAEHGGLRTIGMRQFGAMEIEIERSSWNPRELFDFARKIANYVLTSGTVVKDGDTIGKDAEQKIVVHHGRSQFDNRDVYKVLTP
jgi:hypothetical protein